MLATKLLEAAGNATQPSYIEDVFSTYLYTGNGSTQTINNGIDLSGKGGLVWIKNRTSSGDHYLFDTVRGVDKALQTDTTAAELSVAGNGVNPFNANGFGVNGNIRINVTSNNFASWTLREQPKFFDVVTFTQTGIASGFLTVNHSLGSTPGCIIIKRTSAAQNWLVYHKDTASQYLYLNLTDAAAAGVVCQNVTSTSFDFNLGAFGGSAGTTYVAYLFAHNAGGFGLTGTDNVISCGSYTGNAALNSISLGYEPQLVLIKPVSITGNWEMYDNMRGFARYGDRPLYPNLSNAEGAPYPGDYLAPTATGFELNNNWSANTSGVNYIYIAIRRGPMKVPTDGTTVFKPTVFTSDGTSTKSIAPGFTPDASLLEYRQSWNYPIFTSRLTGNGKLITNLTDAENTSNTSWIVSNFDYSNALMYNDYGGGNLSSRTDANGFVSWCFKRAPGFFDEVCYTGNGTSGTTQSHNLGVEPELMIVKSRSASGFDWVVYAQSQGNTKATYLNSTQAFFTFAGAWNNTSPTSTVFTLGNTDRTNYNGATFVAYLFATCPGVSKVGSYTGNGSTQTINCGFTGGARFVLIRRTDSTGDWYVWDTARGIVSGNDPYLLLNSTAAEVTTTDYIDPVSSGFEISSTAPAAINASGGSYIYLAIA